MALLDLLKEVKPSPDRKIIKKKHLTVDTLSPPQRHSRQDSWVAECRGQPRFPAKMTLVHD